MPRLPLAFPPGIHMGIPSDPDEDRLLNSEARIALYEVTDDEETLWVQVEMKPSPDREHWTAVVKGPSSRESVEDAGATLSERLSERMAGSRRECWHKAMFELDLRLERKGWRRVIKR